RPPPTSTLFPYTTLFRSVHCAAVDQAECAERRGPGAGRLLQQAGVVERQRAGVAVNEERLVGLDIEGGAGQVVEDVGAVGADAEDGASRRLDGSVLVASY